MTQATVDGRREVSENGVCDRRAEQRTARELNTIVAWRPGSRAEVVAHLPSGLR